MRVRAREMDVDAAALCAISIALVVRRRKRRRRNRRIWTREWILQRKEQGAFHQLMHEIRLSDAVCYKNFVRMNATTFEELLHVVAPHITYRDTVMRQAISPTERLSVTL